MDKKAFQNIQKKLGLTNEGTAEALDVELFTVQMWVCGTWPVPRPIAKFLHSLLSMKRDNEAIYMAGYKGRNAGLKEGRVEGKDSIAEYARGLAEGYSTGHNDGYGAGLKAGRKEGSQIGDRLVYDRGRMTGYHEGCSAAMKGKG